MRIFPSLMAANQLYLGEIVVQLEPLCDGFHLDIMDIDFVDNIVGGINLANELSRAVKKPLWIDLFMANPEQVLPRLEIEPEDIITIHAESTFTNDAFTYIRSKQGKASLAINPETSLEKIIPLVSSKAIDHLVLMSVIPGSAGRPFVDSVIEKAKKAYELCKTHNIILAMDGGISSTNIATLAQIPVQDVVLGSAIFHKENPVAELLAYQEWRNIGTNDEQG